MLIDNICIVCHVDVAIDGHARNCESILSEYRQNSREHLFRSGQQFPARQGRKLRRPLNVRKSRTKVMTSRLKANGSIDKRVK